MTIVLEKRPEPGGASNIRKLLLLALGLSGFTNTAIAAEVFKCQSATGRTIYSDVPCSKIGARAVGIVDATPNEVPGTRRSQPNSNQATMPQNRQSPTIETINPTIAKPARDTEARRRRENELNNFLISLASTPEQKSAAQEELATIAMHGGICKLDEEQRKKRDALYNDLGSLVIAHRRAARGPLSALLNTCERI